MSEETVEVPTPEVEDVEVQPLDSDAVTGVQDEEAEPEEEEGTENVTPN